MVSKKIQLRRVFLPNEEHRVRLESAHLLELRNRCCLRSLVQRRICYRLGFIRLAKPHSPVCLPFHRPGWRSWLATVLIQNAFVNRAKRVNGVLWTPVGEFKDI